MFVIWGERFYGKVDQVPGVCHVATLFGHFFWFPLFPLRTYVVADESMRRVKHEAHYGLVHETSYGFAGVRIPMSARSVLVGYLRAVLGFVIFTLGMAVIAFGWELVRPDPTERNPLPAFVKLSGALVVAILLFWLSRLATRAGTVRAAELRKQLGIPVDADEQAGP